MVCGSDTEDSLSAANPDSLTAVEDHTYWTGCIGCVGVIGEVTLSARVDEANSPLVTETSIC